MGYHSMNSGNDEHAHCRARIEELKQEVQYERRRWTEKVDECVIKCVIKDKHIRELECQLARVTAERDDARLRLLSAAGDDLCRLTQEEIKAFSSGAVKIPPEEEFIPSCRIFHRQVAKEVGVLENCYTLAQLIAENEKQRAEIERMRPVVDSARKVYKGVSPFAHLFEAYNTYDAAVDAARKA